MANPKSPFDYSSTDILNAFNEAAKKKGMWATSTSNPPPYVRKKIAALLEELTPIKLLWSIFEYEIECKFGMNDFTLTGWLRWVDLYKNGFYSDELCASVVLRKIFPNRSDELLFCQAVFQKHEEAWFPTSEQAAERMKALQILEDIKRRL